MQKMEDEVKDLEEDERWSREMLEKGNIREREGKPVEEEEGRKEGRQHRGLRLFPRNDYISLIGKRSASPK